MKIVSIVGARPQFIKVAALSKMLRRNHTEVLVHTGQHYDNHMSGIFFQELDIPEPDINLGIGSGSHATQTGAMLVAIERVLLKEKPDYVVLFGDTNSTVAAALAAAKLQQPVVHVEAGLRSFNRAMPEELNRVVTDHLSDLLFCPTQTSVRNLAAEGITKGTYLVGDLMYDTFLQHRCLAHEKSNILRRLGIMRGEFSLVTIHRACNTDEVGHLRQLVQAFNCIDEVIVFPAHPRTRQALAHTGLALNKNVLVVEPLGYLDLLILEESARLIATDSGGVQREAYFVGRPCLTLRDETEWTETVAAGWNLLVGVDPGKILAAWHMFCPQGERAPIFGSGDAAEKIASIIGSRGPHSGADADKAVVVYETERPAPVKDRI